MFFILILLPIFLFGELKYDYVTDDHILIEKNLNELFSALEGEISVLNGGRSGDRLYLGKFGATKLVIRVMNETNSKGFTRLLSYSQMAAEQKLGPSILHYNIDEKVIITEFIEGVPLWPNLLDNENVLLQLSRSLRKIHYSEKVISDQYDVFKSVETQLKELNWKEYLQYVQVIKLAFKKINSPLIPCHNDVHEHNLFYDQNQSIQYIDWGNAGLGDPFYDLACAAVKFHLSKEQKEKFLNEYCLSDISVDDRARFILMQNFVLLKIALQFLDLSKVDNTIKDSIASYLKKNEIEGDLTEINSPQELVEFILRLLELQISSEESRQALINLQNHLIL